MRPVVVNAGSRRGNGLAAALVLALAGSPACARTADEPAPRTGMQPLHDDELAAVRGADGINFNLSHFSLTSDATTPLTLTYQSPNGSAMTLSRLDLSRSDDADAFADPYSLTLRARPGLPDVIAIDFPLNAAGNQAWSLTADFANCDKMVAGTCTGLDFNGGTLQVSGLTMKGGGLYLAPSVIANTQGIAFGLGTQLDIAKLAVYSHGRTAGDVTDTIDTSDSMVLSGIHLVDASTGGAWMLADVTTHPGLVNAVTDANRSYLHVQVGWPTTADPVPAARIAVDNLTFTSPGLNGAAPVVTHLGAASIASLQLNYVDIKLRTTP
jgi:NAD(P)-dependent dehydrogenase (short-subunit alcohol dehydrogenase family)